MRLRSSLLLLLALTLAVTGCGRRPQPPAPVATAQPAVKLTVDADGLYEIAAADLTAAGFDLASADPQVLRLSAGGQPVPFLLTGAGAGRSLRFYGQARGLDAYTAQNVYWLTRDGSGPAIALPQRSARPADPSDLASVVTATVRAEEERQFLPKAPPGEDRWFWASLFAPGEFKAAVHLPAARPEAATLRVRLWGNSAAPANPDHHVIIAVNDVAVADTSWDGMGGHVVTATLPSGTLRAGENQVVLRAPGDTGAEADAVLLDWIEVTYTRQLALDGAALTFGGAARGYAVGGVDQIAAVWDITDPARPAALSDFQAGGGALRFGADATPRRFIAVAPAGLRRPAVQAPAASPDPATAWGQDLRAWPGGADLIVVTAPQFRAALDPLVEARRAAGLRVAVVDLAAVYDAFNFGRADPAAIRDLVRQARAAWMPPAPRFLLLAGDASYDPRGYLKGAEADLIPTQLAPSAYTGWTASDVWFALPDDDPDARPALAVGRFPAQTAAQLAAMVAKTLTYERGEAGAAERGQALLVADNDDAGFTEEAQAFGRTAAGYTTRVITIAGDGSAARGELLRAFADGAGLVGYFGHGSVSVWGQEKVFSVEEAGKLTNRDRLPVVFTVTCLSGLFQHPTTPSLGETLLRTLNGGAVAVLAPSSAAILSDQHFWAGGLAQALAAGRPEGRTVGEILLATQASLPPGPGVREVMLTFNLLGDPALRLR